MIYFTLIAVVVQLPMISVLRMWILLNLYCFQSLYFQATNNMTFQVFNVPVFWPILVMYFITLFCITMKRQIKVCYISCLHKYIISVIFILLEIYIPKNWFHSQSSTCFSPPVMQCNKWPVSCFFLISWLMYQLPLCNFSQYFSTVNVMQSTTDFTKSAKTRHFFATYKTLIFMQSMYLRSYYWEGKWCIFTRIKNIYNAL